MKNERLKKALIEAQNRELAMIPDEKTLGKQYAFTDPFQKKMALLIRKTNHRYVTIGRFTIRRAFLVLIIAILLMTGCMSVKEIREPLFEFFVKDYGKFSRITFSENTASQNQEEIVEQEFEYILPEVPEGYEVVVEEKFQDWHDVEFRNSENHVIYYMKIIPDGLIKEVDTEGAKVEQTIINGNQGIKFSNKGMNYVIWTSEIYSYTLLGSCEMSVLEEIAKKIK